MSGTTKTAYRFKTKPEPYQLEAVKQGLKKRRFGLFFEQRVGKSKTAIDIAGAAHVLFGVRKVLVVCPLSVRQVWESQIATHLPDDIPRRVEMYPSSSEYNYKRNRAALLKTMKEDSRLCFIILNYDVLSRDETARLMTWEPDMVIYDEAHMLKSHNSLRSKQAHRLSSVTKWVIALTGTPVPKRPHDIFGLFRAIDDTILGRSFTKFREEYCVMGGYMGREIIGYKNLDVLSKKIAAHSIRVLRKDVMHEPNVENVIVPVTLSKEEQAVYDDLRSKYVVELFEAEKAEKKKVVADMAGVRIMRLQQVCGGFVNPEGGGEPVQVGRSKLDVAVDLITSKVAGGEKVVVFYRFLAEGQALANELARKGVNVRSIHGATGEKVRADFVREFQRGDVEAIVIQISTGSMGITLDAAHINVFYSLTYRLVDLQQARDRVMGRGQTHDVTNYFLAVKDTVDEKIMKTLAKDEDLASSVADRWRWMLER